MERETYIYAHTHTHTAHIHTHTLSFTHTLMPAMMLVPRSAQLQRRSSAAMKRIIFHWVAVASFCNHRERERERERERR